MNLTADELADVLLVEDDPGDALLIQESFGPADSSNRRCHVASHSDEALRFVRRTGEFAHAPRPKLILLDLNLGQTHGLEVLAELKGDHDLLAIPVVVLSSSRHPTDIDRSYALHANGYIVKPVDLDDFVTAIKTIDACFLRLIEPSAARDHQDDPQHPVLDTQMRGWLAPAERLALIEVMHTTARAEGRDPGVLEYTRWGSIDMERSGAEAYAAQGVDRLVVGMTATDLNEQRRQLEAPRPFTALRR